MLTGNKGNKGDGDCEEKMELKRGRWNRDWANETDGRGDWFSQSLRTAVL